MSDKSIIDSELIKYHSIFSKIRKEYFKTIKDSESTIKTIIHVNPVILVLYIGMIVISVFAIIQNTKGNNSATLCLSIGALGHGFAAVILAYFSGRKESSAILVQRANDIKWLSNYIDDNYGLLNPMGIDSLIESYEKENLINEKQSAFATSWIAVTIPMIFSGLMLYITSILPDWLLNAKDAIKSFFQAVYKEIDEKIISNTIDSIIGSYRENNSFINKIFILILVLGAYIIVAFLIMSIIKPFSRKNKRLIDDLKTIKLYLISNKMDVKSEHKSYQEPKLTVCKKSNKQENTIIKPRPVIIQSILRTSRNSARIWIDKHADSELSYELEYTSSWNKWDTASRIKSSEAVLIINGLSSRHSYFFRIRSYKQIDGLYVYNDWSEIKQIYTI